MIDAQQVRSQKAELRSRIGGLLRQLSPHYRQEQSALACKVLREQDLWRQAGHVLFYAPLPEEVDLWPLLSAALLAGKWVALPWFDVQTRTYQARRVRDPALDIQVGHFGIREPLASCDSFDLKALDLVLVPGVAFDESGRRLGHGKGYYDRLLSQAGGTKCGVGWDLQVCPSVPVLPHDVTLDCILTPTRWLFAGHATV